MSFDDNTTEWHLTPHGWVKGTYRYYDTVQGSPVDPPSDRVETWMQREHQQSEWSRSTFEWWVVWQSSEHEAAARAALRESFEKPYGWPADSSRRSGFRSK